MKADNETKITGFSMFFGAVLFAVCIIVSCDHVGHKHISPTPTVACAAGSLPYDDDVADAGASACR